MLLETDHQLWTDHMLCKAEINNAWFLFIIKECIFPKKGANYFLSKVQRRNMKKEQNTFSTFKKKRHIGT